MMMSKVSPARDPGGPRYQVWNDKEMVGFSSEKVRTSVRMYAFLGVKLLKSATERKGSQQNNYVLVCATASRTAFLLLTVQGLQGELRLCLRPSVQNLNSGKIHNS
jgi:hypothetical protein